MKRLNVKDGVAFALVAATIVLTALVYPQLPERMATHFDFHGQPNDWMDVRFGAWLMPAVALLVWPLIRFAEYLVPKEKRERARTAPMSTLALLFAGFLCAVQLILLGVALKYPINVTSAVTFLMGLLWIALAQVLPRTRPNPIVGIRTRHTLRSEDNWQRTHKLAGVLFTLTGIIAMVAAFCAGPLAIFVTLLALIVAAVVPAVYSRVIARREQRQR